MTGEGISSLTNVLIKTGRRSITECRSRFLFCARVCVCVCFVSTPGVGVIRRRRRDASLPSSRPGRRPERRFFFCVSHHFGNSLSKMNFGGKRVKMELISRRIVEFKSECSIETTCNIGLLAHFCRKATKKQHKDYGNKQK